MVALTVEPFRYAAMSSKDRCFGRSSSKSIADTWPFWPKKFRLVGSTKLTLTNRAEFGNENPRSITPFTTLNVVVTPQMPRASTVTASAQNPFSRRSTRSPTRRSWTKSSIPIHIPRNDNTTISDDLFREFRQRRSEQGQARFGGGGGGSRTRD